MRASRASPQALLDHHILRSRQARFKGLRHGCIIASASSSSSSATPKRRGVHTKVQAIKWSMTLETAKNLSIMWAKAHMAQGSKLRLLLGMLFPKWTNAPEFEVQDIAPFYIPAFMVDAIVRAKVIQGSEAYDVPISVENGYFSGTDRKPLSQVQFTGPNGLSAGECEPFDEHKHSRLPSAPRSPVTILPFEQSPLGLLAIRRQGGRIAQDPSTVSTAEEDQQGANTASSFDLSRSSVKFFTAYPLYVPVFLSKVRISNLQQRDQDSASSPPHRDITVALVAHSTSQAMLSWASRAYIYDAEDLNPEEGSHGWRGYSQKSRGGSDGLTLVKSGFSGQPLSAESFTALLQTPWEKQVDMSLCADPEGRWRASPAVMDYVKCSESNKEYLDRLWSVEEAKTAMTAVNHMDDDVQAIKLDVYNRKLSKLAKDDIKRDLEERIANLESEAKEARPAWFNSGKVK